MGSCSDRALEKENYVCFRCFQKLLFKGSENYDISPNELTLPSAFLEDTGKADVSRAGRRSGDKCVGGERHWGGDQMKEDFRQEASKDQCWCKVLPDAPREPHPAAHQVMGHERVTCLEVARRCFSIPQKSPFRWSRRSWPSPTVYHDIPWWSSSS